MDINTLKNTFLSDSFIYDNKTYFFKTLSSHDNEVQFHFHVTRINYLPYVEFKYEYNFNFSGDVLTISIASRSYKDTYDNSVKKKFLGLIPYTHKYNTNYETFEDISNVFKIREQIDKDKPKNYALYMANLTHTEFYYNYVEDVKNEILEKFQIWKENN